MNSDHIDSEGFRANVGIIVSNEAGRLLLAGRIGSRGWQFPQGGMQKGENPDEAMYRELHEEIGLGREDVRVLGQTAGWLRYRLPSHYVRRGKQPLCIGQKQRWYMLKLVCPESRLRLDASASPEFDRWRWVDYWSPIKEVIYFKRRVYALALSELGPCLYPDGLPPQPAWWPERWRTAFDKDLVEAEEAREDNAAAELDEGVGHGC